MIYTTTYIVDWKSMYRPFWKTLHRHYPGKCKLKKRLLKKKYKELIVEQTRRMLMNSHKCFIPISKVKVHFCIIG